MNHSPQSLRSSKIEVGLYSVSSPGLWNTHFKHIAFKQSEITVFDRLNAGERVSLTDPEWKHVNDIVTRTRSLLPSLNASTSAEETRKHLSNITGRDIDESTTIFGPYHTNFGRNTTIGKRVIINHDCTFLGWPTSQSRMMPCSDQKLAS